MQRFPVLDLVSQRYIREEAAALRERFVRDGAVVLPDFFAPETLVAANDELQRRWNAIDPEAWLESRNEAMKSHACDVVPWAPQGEDAFLALGEDPALRAASEAVMGGTFHASHCLVMFSVGGGRGQAWHQDSPPDDPDAFLFNRLVYTEDVHAEDGAFVFVPGSHRAGRISRGDAQESLPGEVALTPSAGTLVLLNGLVYHRVTPNRTGKPRLSVNFRAYPAGVSTEIGRIGIYRNTAYDFAAGEPVDR